MKIQKTGLRITEVCEAIPQISVDGEGAVRIDFRIHEDAEIESTPYMTQQDLDQLIEALAEVKRHAESAPRPAKGEGRVVRLRDKAGDEWTWRDDHNGYVLEAINHEGCRRGSCGGESMKWIEQDWGPITVLERG